MSRPYAKPTSDRQLLFRCPVCLASHKAQRDLVLSSGADLLEVYRCSCGIGYTQWALAGKAPDLYCSRYYDHVRYQSQAGRRAYIAHLAGFVGFCVEKEPVSSRTMLDVGCATGDFVEWALSAGWHTEGVDISDAAIELGKKRGLPVSVASLSTLQDAPGQYDVLTLWDVLEHLPNPRQSLLDMKAALKPNGLLLLKTVSRLSIIESCARCLYHTTARHCQGPLRRIYVPGHLYYFTPASLERLLLETGWKPVILSQDDTPARALFSSVCLRLIFGALAWVQNKAGRSYELLVACRKA